MIVARSKPFPPDVHFIGVGGSGTSGLAQILRSRGIRVTGVMTSNHEGPREQGKAAIHFFPGGYAEPAYVWLGEEDDPDEPAEAAVTLSLDSLMGRVTRHSEALSPTTFAKEME